MKFQRDKKYPVTNFKFQKALLFWSMALGFWNFAVAQNFPVKPNPPRLVNDLANVLSAEENNSLEQKLVAYSDSTTTQIAIVIIETLDGAEVGSYAAELGEKWGVGTKKNLNGIMILMAKKERKVTIRTGYGVEEKLGAVTCDHIIKNKLIPNFKNGNFYKGFDAATDEIMQRLSGMYVNDNDETSDDGLPIWVIVLIVLVAFFVLPLISGKRGGGTTYGSRGYRNYGGGLGGFGGFGGGGGSSGGFGGFGGGGFSGGGASGGW